MPDRGELVRSSDGTFFVSTGDEVADRVYLKLRDSAAYDALGVGPLSVSFQPLRVLDRADWPRYDRPLDFSGSDHWVEFWSNMWDSGGGTDQNTDWAQSWVR